MATPQTQTPTPAGPKRLTPEQIDQLQEEYREVALADDEEGKSIKRAITAKLRRVTHAELHPNCKKVTIDVPYAVDGSTFKINEKPFFGSVTVDQCVAQELAGMIDRNRRMDAERLRDGGRIVDMGAIQNLIAAIQAE